MNNYTTYYDINLAQMLKESALKEGDIYDEIYYHAYEFIYKFATPNYEKKGNQYIQNFEDNKSIIISGDKYKKLLREFHLDSNQNILNKRYRIESQSKKLKPIVYKGETPKIEDLIKHDLKHFHSKIFDLLDIIDDYSLNILYYFDNESEYRHTEIHEDVFLKMIILKFKLIETKNLTQFIEYQLESNFGKDQNLMIDKLYHLVIDSSDFIGNIKSTEILRIIKLKKISLNGMRNVYENFSKKEPNTSLDAKVVNSIDELINSKFSNKLNENDNVNLTRKKASFLFSALNERGIFQKSISNVDISIAMYFLFQYSSKQIRYDLVNIEEYKKWSRTAKRNDTNLSKMTMDIINDLREVIKILEKNFL